VYFGLVPRPFQSGVTDHNGRITRRGNPLARTILTECAWVSLRYNPWAKANYERISGRQKTCKKKAAIALARKIVIIAWAMLRDEKDWDPRTVIQTTESFGRMPLGLKEILQTMKPKELSQQRHNHIRLAREVREAKAAAESFNKDAPGINQSLKTCIQKIPKNGGDRHLQTQDFIVAPVT
jgi:transposase